ncbi:MAG: Ldh family oxidoreductase, partial [Chloroflexi bacterium]|nr:Ldh family oxidoreductase [Chloroflexota bacterium]
MPTFAVEPLTNATARVLSAAGTPDDIADKLARWLINANLSGHPSHGVIRVTQYLAQIKDGAYRPAELPRVVSESDTSVVMEGGGAFGHLAAEELTIRLVEKSRVSRVAVGGIARCNHIGRLGEWSELAVSMGAVFLMVAGGPGMMRTAPFGGREGRMSTNPISFGAPASDADPIILDFATTAAAEGKIRV